MIATAGKSKGPLVAGLFVCGKVTVDVATLLYELDAGHLRKPGMRPGNLKQQSGSVRATPRLTGAGDANAEDSRQPRCRDAS